MYRRVFRQTRRRTRNQKRFYSDQPPQKRSRIKPFLYGVLGGAALTVGGSYFIKNSDNEYATKIRSVIPAKVLGCSNCGSGKCGCGAAGKCGCAGKCSCCSKGGPRAAVVVLQPHHKSGVSGIIQVMQESPEKPAKITGIINGLAPGKHGLHVHEYGDLSDCCSTIGDHYNPLNKQHGSPKNGENRHLGDLGNIVANDKGNALIELEDNYISLYGCNSIYGRALDVHAGEDDGGVGTHDEDKGEGNSGPKLACGVVGVAKCSCHDKKDGHHQHHNHKEHNHGAHQSHKEHNHDAHQNHKGHKQ